MNFITEYKKGQQGSNKGLPMGEGLATISKAINGVQRARVYGVAAPPKAGKSTFADVAFVIEPYLYAIQNNIPIEWIYNSFEIDRVSKEFDFAAHFLYSDYGIFEVKLPEGITANKGKKSVEISADYLRGRLQDDNEKVILVNPEILELLKKVYEERIISLFGEYDEKGIQIRKGYITFIEEKENPTGIRNYLLRHAEKQGSFVKIPAGKDRKRIVGYLPNNPDKFTIIITDHLRKLIPERGWQMKQTVDKFSEYSIELKNWCQYTFVHIIHTNRNIADEKRLASSKDLLYPTSDDIKDTGNLSEDVDYLFTMFNPNDERYRLNKHFGTIIKDTKGNEFFPDMRTVHLVENRHGPFPQHFRVNMKGGVKSFSKFKE